MLNNLPTGHRADSLAELSFCLDVLTLELIPLLCVM